MNSAMLNGSLRKSWVLLVAAVCLPALAGTDTLSDIAHKRAPTEDYDNKKEVRTGIIRALRQGPRGELIFTLDNNQVWRQDQPSPNISFSVGEAVRIEHGAMSSLWLVADHGRKTKVKRIS
jgi:hypothetical protein